MKKTLAIVASHPRTAFAFDMNRTDCDIWMFNEALSGQMRNKWNPPAHADAVFQMHVEAIWRNPQNRNDPGHAKWLMSGDTPKIYMQKQSADVPMSEEYPLQAVIDMLGGDPDHFLSSSVALAIGLAIHLDCYDRIEMYGVAMESNTEYQFQREGVAFWKGFAMGRGIDVYFADETFRTPVYGYEGEVSLPYEVFEQRMTELEPLIKDLTAQYKGKSVMLKRIVADLIDKPMKKEVLKALEEQISIGLQLGKLDGAYQENERYKGKADEMKASASGEFVFSRQEFETSVGRRKEEAEQHRVRANACTGQMELIHENIERAAKNSPKRQKLLAAFQQLLQQYLNESNMTAVLLGAAEENHIYMSRLDKSVRAAGGAKAEEVLIEVIQHA